MFPHFIFMAFFIIVYYRAFHFILQAKKAISHGNQFSWTMYRVGWLANAGFDFAAIEKKQVGNILRFPTCHLKQIIFFHVHLHFSGSKEGNTIRFPVGEKGD